MISPHAHQAKWIRDDVVLEVGECGCLKTTPLALAKKILETEHGFRTIHPSARKITLEIYYTITDRITFEFSFDRRETDDEVRNRLY